jgi:uncharacterized protein YdhG (YjbR/CyaY superfamily)
MTSSDVDEYFQTLPEQTATVLQELRTHLRNLVPDGEERISYGIPTLDVDGRHVVHFAGFKHHVGIYPVTDTDPELEASLAPYRSGRGTVRFSLDRPLPYEVIDPLVAFLVARHQAR